MKFDMTKAFDDAMAILQANLALLVALAGVFVFLPTLLLNVIADPASFEAAMQSAPQDDPEAVLKIMGGYFREAAPWFAISIVASAIGTLAMLALAGDRNRLTVGEAITVGLKGFLPLLLASILLGLAISAVIMLLTLPAALLQTPALLILLIPIMLAVIVFLYMRFIMVSPVMALERQFNPLTALTRSWELVRGNTRWLFLFMLLVWVAIMVVYIPVILLGQLIGVLSASATMVAWVNGLISALASTAIAVFSVAITLAIYRQLAGPHTGDVTETFE